MSLNPQSSDDPIQWKDKKRVGVESATVVRTKEHKDGDTVGHVCYVQPNTLDQTIPADVVVSHTGDVEIPTEGSRVLIAYRPNERAVVIGQRYQKSDTVPPYKPGERVVGHPATDSTIRLRNDGTIVMTGDSGNTVTLKSNGDIVINGGSTQAITDVTAKDTNSNDGITELEITRSPSVYLPDNTN